MKWILTAHKTRTDSTGRFVITGPYIPNGAGPSSKRYILTDYKPDTPIRFVNDSIEDAEILANEIVLGIYGK